LGSDVFLRGQYIELGVNSVGSLGTGYGIDALDGTVWGMTPRLAVIAVGFWI
jgi:hypothetical protein